MNAAQNAAAVALKTELERPEKPMRLFDLVDALNAIDDQLEVSGGELTPEIEKALEDLQGNITTKVENICRLRQNWIRSAESCDAEAERLQARAKSYKRRAESLRTYLHAALKRWGMDKLKLPTFSVWIQASPLSIRWTRDVELLPDEFKRVKVEPDLARAKEELKAGAVLPDGFEVSQSTHLRIQ